MTRKFPMRPLAALALCAGLAWPATAAWAQAAAAASAASAPANAVRAELVPPLQAAQKALAAKQYDEAQRQLQLTDAVADKSAYERYVIGRMRAGARAGLNDAPGLVQAIEDTLATGLGEPALRLDLMNQAANAAYVMKDYAATVRWSHQYLEAGGDQLEARLRLAQSLYLLEQHAEAAKVLDDLAQRQAQAGQQPGEPQLRLQASNYVKLKDDAGYLRVVEQLAAKTAKPDYWAELLARVSQQPAFDERLRIDVLRLGMARKAWSDAAFHVELADRALAMGFAAEAEHALLASKAAGVQGQGAVAAERDALLERASKQAQIDRRDTSATTPAAQASKSGQALFNAGYNDYTDGRSAQGLALMEQALAKGLARQADDAKLRLGAAYAATGDTAKARQWLAPLAAAGHGDGLSDIARLWLLGPGS
ncbi:MAG: hypothetical protein OEU93_11540 [Rubrivivax sp.]|nr:hypothetical protein [Rubrivivax sp.]